MFAPISMNICISHFYGERNTMCYLWGNVNRKILACMGYWQFYRAIKTHCKCFSMAVINTTGWRSIETYNYSPCKAKYEKAITCFVVLKVLFKVKKMVAQCLYCFHRTRIKISKKNWAWYLCFYHCWQWLISFSINRVVVLISQREVTLKMTIAFTLQDVYTRESVK